MRKRGFENAAIVWQGVSRRNLIASGAESRSRADCLPRHFRLTSPPFHLEAKRSQG